MKGVNAEVLKERFTDLPPAQQREVFDFVEFLLARKRRRKSSQSVKKDKLLDVSVWSNDDLKAIDAVAEDLNKWPIDVKY